MSELVKVIQSGKFVILDTETTGLDSDGEIVQISIVGSKGDVLLNSYVRPAGDISQSAINIHGITHEKVKFAPSIGALLPQIIPLLSGTNVIVYNADYDHRILVRSLYAHKLPTIAWKKLSPWHCAMLEFARVYGLWDPRRKSFRWQKLSTACDYYGIPVIDAHDSLADCKMTLEVCKAMAGIKKAEKPVQTSMF